ncbi:WD repeat-containing protein 4 [Irineochytrium annulatum]|nr:WD repeat-containing protein 4 [Irineochytrium annulatum]
MGLLPIHILASSGRVLVLVYGSRFIAIDPTDGRILADAEDRDPGSSRTEGSAVIKTEDFPKAYIRAVAIQGERMITASDDKLLKVWDMRTWKLESTRDAFKRVNAIRFSPDGSKFLVGDKFGDVYSYHVDATVPGFHLMLGHVSIITDMDFSVDGGLIITADRDEKVRVTKYPHTFEVQSFCLGHKQLSAMTNRCCESTPELTNQNAYRFVSSISHYPGAPNQLISGGGDPHLLVWDILTGDRLQTVDLSSHVADINPEPSKQLYVSHIIPSDTARAVAVTCHAIPCALIYSAAKAGELRMAQRVPLPSAPLGAAWDCDGRLWVSCVGDGEGGVVVVAFKRIGRAEV